MPVIITDYQKPRSLKEALELLADEHGKTVAIGGGVSIVLSGAPRRMRAVDLQWAGLDEISTNGKELRLGATATFDQIVRSSSAARVGNGILCYALKTAASEPIRRLITVGGNIVQCYYWATLPPLLLALDAKIHLRTLQHRRTLGADEFFAEPPPRVLVPGEIVTEVTIPLAPKRKVGFEKFSKTANDYALIHLVISYAVQGRKIVEPRVVVGACTNLPVRCHAAEEFLEGQPSIISLENALKAGQIVAHHVALRRDSRASSAYRRRLMAVLVQRLLSRMSSEGKESQHVEGGLR